MKASSQFESTAEEEGGCPDDPSTSNTTQEKLQQQEKADLEILAKGDRRAVLFLRVATLLFLASAAVALCVSIYFYLDNNEKEDYENSYQEQATKVLDTVAARLNDRINTLDYFALSLVSTSINMNIEWPRLYLPHVEVRANRTNTLASTLSISILPLVTNETRMEWQMFANENQDWRKESMAFQAVWANSSWTEPKDWAEQVGRISMEITKYQQDGSKAVHDGQGPYLPLWESGPGLHDSSIINMDLRSDPAFAKVLDAGLMSGRVVFGESFEPFATKESTEKYEILGMYKKRWEDVGKKFQDGPYVDLIHPLYDDFFGEPNLVGLTHSYVEWREYFTDILPEGDGPLEVTLANRCGPKDANGDSIPMDVNGHHVLQNLGKSHSNSMDKDMDMGAGSDGDSSMDMDMGAGSDGDNSMGMDMGMGAGSGGHGSGDNMGGHGHGSGHRKMNNMDMTGNNHMNMDMSDNHMNMDTNMDHGMADGHHGMGHHHLMDTSSVDQTFHFIIDGATAVYAGSGDFEHDNIDKMTHGSFSMFSDRLNVPSSKRVDGECAYEIHIYPTREMEESYSSRNPLLFALFIFAAFVFVSLVFFVYDWAVKRNQAKVMDTALKSGAIVSSLFPAQVRQRLMERHDVHDDTDQTILSRFNSVHQVGSDTDDNTSAEPVADLYPFCSVLFADISGFTNWSSTRAPTGVFKLLETIYGEFDTICSKRKVFKVETIGDCYMAATGLPEPQSSHALILGRFALDCMMRMSKCLPDLAKEFGEDTKELKLRIGIHSGPVTAGVLRGAKSRFQLFGDTVNTASRMESTGQAGRIQVSEATAEQLIRFGKQHWLTKREDTVEAKGKGQLTSYWISQTDASAILTNEASFRNSGNDRNLKLVRRPSSSSSRKLVTQSIEEGDAANDETEPWRNE